jgi:hypothetical protein
MERRLPSGAPRPIQQTHAYDQNAKHKINVYLKFYLNQGQDFAKTIGEAGGNWKAA